MSQASDSTLSPDVSECERREDMCLSGKCIACRAPLYRSSMEPRARMKPGVCVVAMVCRRCMKERSGRREYGVVIAERFLETHATLSLRDQILDLHATSTRLQREMERDKKKNKQ
jgi:hypothetical protein